MKRLILAASMLLVLATFVAVSQTYEQIMAAISEYPGPEEPLYEPGPDEAIWLTDLEGHADIYDNDSIKINYADWFDKSQISRIEIKRNGIKMQFLPDMLDILTNDQMKTFDGNPRENTPSSAHTDHAIFGYEYAFWFYGGNPGLRIETASISSPVHYTGEVAVNFGGGHETDMRLGSRYVEGNWSFAWMVDHFKEFKAMGFEMVSFQIYYFMHSAQANEVFAMYRQDRSIHSFASTLEDNHIRDILRAIDAAGLDAELRIEIWVSEEDQEDYSHRGALRPSNLDAWSESYGDICEHLGRIMEEEGGDLFTPMVELSKTETHESNMEALFERLRGVYSGRLSVNQQTHSMLNGDSTYDRETDWRVIVKRSKFWDFPEMEIGFTCNQDAPAIEYQLDQRLSVMVESLVRNWGNAVRYYRTEYPSHPIRYSELTASYFDGASLGRGWFAYHPERMQDVDFQEQADWWAAYLIMTTYLEIDAVDVFAIWPYREEWRLQDYDPTDFMLGGRPSERCVVELIGAPVEAIPCMDGRGIVCGQENEDN